MRFLKQGMTGLSKNPDALGKKKKSYVLQHISFCQPANSGAYHAARSNKKGIRKLTAGGEQAN